VTNNNNNNFQQQTGTPATGVLANLFKKPKGGQQSDRTDQDDDEFQVHGAFGDDFDDAADDADIDESDDEPVKVPKNGKVNMSNRLPYITSTYEDGSKTKHFLVYLLVAPPGDEEATIEIHDRDVTATVQSIKWGHQMSVKLINAMKQASNMSEELATTVQASLLQTMEQIKPWRYDVKAPFQLDTQNFKTYRMRPTVGHSLNEHHMLVIDAAEYKKQISSAPVLL
jgi:hypothetical protein